MVSGGYRLQIHYVPATLPDKLNTRALVEWEYALHLFRAAKQIFGASEDRSEWMHSAQSDCETALPLYELRSFAHATGHYDGLPLQIRLDQIDNLLELCEQLYPQLRIYLFDEK